MRDCSQTLRCIKDKVRLVTCGMQPTRFPGMPILGSPGFPPKTKSWRRQYKTFFPTKISQSVCPQQVFKASLIFESKARSLPPEFDTMRQAPSSIDQPLKISRINTLAYYDEEKKFFWHWHLAFTPLVQALEAHLYKMATFYISYYCSTRPSGHQCPVFVTLICQCGAAANECPPALVTNIRLVRKRQNIQTKNKKH